MSYLSVSIVMITFNGKGLLENSLPRVFNAIEGYGGEAEFILVDNGGSDGSEEFVKQNFPWVKLIKIDKNAGFSKASNQGIKACKNQIVILLNDDILVTRDFIHPLTVHFEDKEVFAVRPGLQAEPSQQGADLIKPSIGGYFRYGFIYPNINSGHTNYNLAFIAGGGASAFDREKFLSLDGFDELFSPFYYEDVDISYRAWKRGWKIIYEPDSLVYHIGNATIRRLHKFNYITRIAERNRYLLIWKNITDPSLFIQHCIFVLPRLVINLIQFRFAQFEGFFCALAHLKEVSEKRKKEKRLAIFNDREIFRLFSSSLSNEQDTGRMNTSKYPGVSILMTTFNGKELLEGLLPLVKKAAELYPGKSEVILIDDAGTDGSAEFVENNFPQIRLFKLEKNVGPLQACNRGFKECRNQIVILLDNDVVVAVDFIKHLARHFNKQDVFAVRPAYRIDPRNADRLSYKPSLVGKFKFGLIYPNEVRMWIGRFDFAFIAGGGGSAYDRQKLIELGCFDPIFSPFYYEDVDISYRAWKRRWKIIFEPRSHVFHVGTGTITRFYSSNYITMICERNRYFLVWKNISDGWFLFQNIIFIPVRIIFYLLKGRFASIAGILYAVFSIKKILKKRKLDESLVKMSDREIFNIFK